MHRKHVFHYLVKMATLDIIKLDFPSTHCFEYYKLLSWLHEQARTEGVEFMHANKI